MLTGAHVLIYSSNTDADKAFLRDVLGFPHVDAGGGRLIFGLPPTEVAMHETDAAGGTHELYLICDDIRGFVAKMQEQSVPCDEVAEHGWGTVSGVTLPSGIKLGVYEAHHARPAAKKKAGKVLRATAKAVRKATKKATKKAKKAAKKKPSG